MAVLFQRQGPAVGPSSVGRADRASAPTAPPGLIERIIEQRLVTAEFQPIVRLSTGEVVAFESLARGPADSALSSPAAMFRAAASVGVAAELDQVAHLAAYKTVLHSNPPEGLTFFINFSPALPSAPMPEDIEEMLGRAPGELCIVAELAEHELLADPIRTFAAADRVRRLGMRVALDNLGSLEALPLLPLLQPDVIKLDPALLAAAGRQKVAKIVDALIGYSDNTNGLIIGQGIERPEQLPTVTAVGATLGQGYLFGPPVTVPMLTSEVREPAELLMRYEPADATTAPYDMLLHRRTPTLVEHTFLQAMGAHLEERADTGGESFVMFLVSPSGRPLSGLSATRLRGLGRKASMLVALTPSPDLTTGREVRVAHLPVGDPAREDHVLAVLTPTAGALLAARPDGDTSGFHCMLTRDRWQVIQACRSLLARYTDLTAGG